ncbi:hypothetical protein F2Y83_21715 [Bacteroides cellulosilyticus]|nr:hypothetical protein F2Y70_26160 [Bacteroides cellulosilyticus]KAA5431624.1 hypothetical protein F2Y83_21715 [Bacteroides cellulosilyticus]KAA5434603.1 hypothetical protein F2Y53_24330 [Bacteroides cellulosilyticus]KAA5436081.1 hypothetical protein F2Y74_14765 [Bacteroides cellulosilyticus]
MNENAEHTIKTKATAKSIRTYFIIFFLLYIVGDKDNANREQNKKNSFIFYAEIQLIFTFIIMITKKPVIRS